MKNKVKVLAIIGKSGTGKSSIFKRLKAFSNKNINYIISSTTRPLRQGEVDGVDYHFIEHDDFVDLMEQGKIVEMSVFRDWCYGTCIDAFDPNKINIGCFDPMRVDILADQSEFIDLKIILVTAPDKERLMRQLSREEEPDVQEIIRRYQTDEEDFKYLENYIEIKNSNGKIEEACAEILSIVETWDKAS